MGRRCRAGLAEGRVRARAGEVGRCKAQRFRVDCSAAGCAHLADEARHDPPLDGIVRHHARQLQVERDEAAVRRRRREGGRWRGRGDGARQHVQRQSWRQQQQQAAASGGAHGRTASTGSQPSPPAPAADRVATSGCTRRRLASSRISCSWPMLRSYCRGAAQMGAGQGSASGGWEEQLAAAGVGRSGRQGRLAAQPGTSQARTHHLSVPSVLLL